MLSVIRKIVFLLFLLIAFLFAIQNWDVLSSDILMKFDLNPFKEGAKVFGIPLVLFGFGVLLTGFILGGVSGLYENAARRMQLRSVEKQLRKTEKELEKTKERAIKAEEQAKTTEDKLKRAEAAPPAAPARTGSGLRLPL